MTMVKLGFHTFLLIIDPQTSNVSVLQRQVLPQLSLFKNEHVRNTVLESRFGNCFVNHQPVVDSDMKWVLIRTVSLFR